MALRAAAQEIESVEHLGVRTIAWTLAGAFLPIVLCLVVWAERPWLGLVSLGALGAVKLAMDGDRRAQSPPERMPRLSRLAGLLGALALLIYAIGAGLPAWLLCLPIMLAALLLLPAHGGRLLAFAAAASTLGAWHLAGAGAPQLVVAGASLLGMAVIFDRVLLSQRLILQRLEHSGRALAEANRMLSERATRAESATRQKSDYLAGMSHEIRTPMTSVLGALDLLRRQELSPQQDKLVDIASRSGRALLALLSNILDLSKIEAGRLVLTRGPMRLTSCLEDALASVRPAAEGKGLALALLLDETLPEELVCDEARLRQILINLLGNAVKWTETGGVVLRVEAAGPQRLRFEVEDTGPGIAPEKIPALFQPFSRLAEGRRSGKEGHGLGLTLVRRLAEALGGAAGVRSEVGQGACFWVEVVYEVGAELGREEVIVTPRAQSLHILVAEDNPMNQAVLAGLLEARGHRVTVVGDGERVVTEALSGAHDVVLMDRGLPELDGLEATSRIRAAEREREQSAQLPIFALTASATVEDREACLRAGMNAFLSKPLDPVELDAALGGVEPRRDHRAA